MNNRWRKNRSAVYNIAYHLIWCPKYRKRVLIGAVEKRIKQLLNEKAKEMGLVIEEMEIMPDHVHLFIKCDPTDNPQFIVKNLKGYTSFFLRKEFPHIKSRMPCMWTRSFYCESIGHISESSIKKYIEQQKNK